MAKVTANMNTPLPQLRLYQTSRQIALFKMLIDDGELNLNPPYQRGDVWGVKRQRNLIKSILIGVPIPSIILNDRFRAQFKGDQSTQYAVIDGKQRITAIMAFMRGTLFVPSCWFPHDHLKFHSDAEVCWLGLTVLGQRSFKANSIQISEAVIDTLAGEQEVFDLINFGGLAQGEVDSDIEEES
jgi:hypothetical protein